MTAGDIVSTEDLGLGTVISVDDHTALVKFIDGPDSPLEVDIDTLTETDIPNGYGDPNRALDHAEEWW